MYDEFDNSIEPICIKRIEISSISGLTIENVRTKSGNDLNIDIEFNLNIYDENTIKRMKALLYEMKESGGFKNSWISCLRNYKLSFEIS